MEKSDAEAIAMTMVTSPNTESRTTQSDGAENPPQSDVGNSQQQVQQQPIVYADQNGNPIQQPATQQTQQPIVLYVRNVRHHLCIVTICIKRLQFLHQHIHFVYRRRE